MDISVLIRMYEYVGRFIEDAGRMHPNLRKHAALDVLNAVSDVLTKEEMLVVLKASIAKLEQK